MADSANRPDPAWYFGHNRRLTQVAEQHGMDPDSVIDASGAMSPQNDPDSEFRAVSAMSDAITKKRQIRAVNDVSTSVSAEQAKKGVKPRVVMQAGERRTISSMTPEDMQAATSTANVRQHQYRCRLRRRRLPQRRDQPQGGVLDVARRLQRR